MEQLTREQIEQRSALLREKLDLPRLGGSAYVWEMTGPERAKFELCAIKRSGPDDLAWLEHWTTWLAIFTLADEAGKRIFGEADFATVAKLPGSVLTEIHAVAMRVNALGDEDVAEIMRGFENGQSVISTTA